MFLALSALSMASDLEGGNSLLDTVFPGPDKMLDRTLKAADRMLGKTATSYRTEPAATKARGRNISDGYWAVKEPRRGDHIRVVRSGGPFNYEHHGIYVSDSEVIHFTGPDNGMGIMAAGTSKKVTATSLAEFLKGDQLEVKEYSDKERRTLNDPETVVEIARAHIGDRRYNILFNNCEHFANYCTTNVRRSEQVKRCIRKLSGPGLAISLFSKLLSPMRQWRNGFL